MIFHKHDTATISGEKYICIVADEDYAVLAEYSGKVNLGNARIYSNYDGWEEHIIGLEKEDGECGR
jgi:hypothetical protein